MTTWTTIPLAEAAEILGGATPHRENPQYWNGDIPWLTPTDLPPVGAGITNVQETADSITQEGLGSCSASLLPRGAVLFSSRASIGKVGIADVPLATNQGFANFIPRDGVESRYLAWCLSHHARQISRLAGSTTFKEVTKRSLRRFPIPMPPLPEQRRIVELLDQVDRLRQLRAEADEKAERVLPVLFTRILGRPEAWPDDSDCRLLGSLASFVSGATPPKSVEAFWQGGVPWVSPKDMKTDFLSDSQDHVSEAAVQETNLRLIERGSALLVVRGMILARTIPLAINLHPVTINQDMKALLPKREPITGAYLWAALTVAKQQLRGLVRTAGHGTRKLDTPDLMRFRIPLPTSDQIQQVGSAVDTHRRLVESRQKGALAIHRLFRLLLSRAFSGSLTSAWRENEAAELVEESSRDHSGSRHMESVA